MFCASLWLCAHTAPAPFTGSSKGRGTRACGWFQDLLDDRQVEGITSAILLDGITGWARAGDEYTRLMDEYDAERWVNSTK
jgi:arsenical-resistance protein 2